MTKLSGLRLAVATLVIVSAAAFAKDKNRHRVVISQTVQVGNTRLAPGEYTMQWNESGTTAEVSFVQNGKSVAEVPAKIVNLARPPASDALTVRTETDNTVALEEVQFGGHKEAFSASSITRPASE